MSDANKAHRMRIYDEVFNEGKLDVVDEVIAADAVDPSPPPDSTGDVREDLQDFTRLMRSSFPRRSLRGPADDRRGDLVAAYCACEGTDEGDFMGIPAIGDLAGLMQQLGPAPSA